MVGFVRVMSPMDQLQLITRIVLSQVAQRMQAPRKRLRLRRMQDQEGPRPHVCRRLFADDSEPADPGAHDNLINQINEEINRSLDDACKKYNFDFRSEVPLEGDWMWERIDRQSRPTKPLVEPPSDVPENPKDPPAKPQEPPTQEGL